MLYDLYIYTLCYIIYNVSFLTCMYYMFHSLSEIKLLALHWFLYQFCVLILSKMTSLSQMT